MRDFGREKAYVLFTLHASTCYVSIDLKSMTIGKIPKESKFSLCSHYINRNEDYIHGIEVIQRRHTSFFFFFFKFLSIVSACITFGNSKTFLE